MTHSSSPFSSFPGSSSAAPQGVTCGDSRCGTCKGQRISFTQLLESKLAEAGILPASAGGPRITSVQGVTGRLFYGPRLDLLPRGIIDSLDMQLAMQGVPVSVPGLLVPAPSGMNARRSSVARMVEELLESNARQLAQVPGMIGQKRGVVSVDALSQAMEQVAELVAMAEQRFGGRPGASSGSSVRTPSGRIISADGIDQISPGKIEAFDAQLTEMGVPEGPDVMVKVSGAVSEFFDSLTDTDNTSDEDQVAQEILQAFVDQGESQAMIALALASGSRPKHHIYKILNAIKTGGIPTSREEWRDLESTLPLPVAGLILVRAGLDNVVMRQVDQNLRQHTCPTSANSSPSSPGSSRSASSSRSRGQNGQTARAGSGGW